MLLSKTELEEMTGYSLEYLGVNLNFVKGEYEDGSFRKTKLTLKELTELFERVSYLSYESGAKFYIRKHRILKCKNQN